MPSAVTIAELSGPRRSLELVGPGLPMQGAPWGVEQRLVTEWYPGNEEATQHVLGPTEQVSSWNGVWNTTRLVTSPCQYVSAAGASPVDVTNAFTLFEIVDDFVRAGRLLRVVWVQDAVRSIARVGRVSSFRCEFVRADDARWSMELEWIGRGTPRQKIASFRGENASAANAAALVVLNELVASIEEAKIVRSTRGVARSASAFTLGSLERLADAPLRLARQVAGVATQITNKALRVSAIIDRVGSLPDQLAGQASGVAASARFAANEFSRAISARSPETLATDSRVSSMTKAYLYFSAAGRKAELATRASVSLTRTLRRPASALATGSRRRDAAAPSEFLAAHRAKDGETFADISRRYYGTADRGGDVARANGLPGYQVAPESGTILLVPALSDTARAGRSV